MRIPTSVEKQRPGKGRRKSIETVKNPNLVVAVAVSVGHDDGSARRARCRRRTGFILITTILLSTVAVDRRRRHGARGPR